jgi:phage repressor protein C with HTH and peptisase S24 domain
VSRIIGGRSISRGDTYQSIEVYSLVTAGGLFRDNPDAHLPGRIHPPQNLRALTHDYFVVLIEGHSMEPVIPSGSYCLLRFSVPGSMSGRTVLVEEREIAECAYTLKRYVRRPPPKDNPSGRGRIFLDSFNPDQPDIELHEDGEGQDQRYAVIAEFIQVLKPPLDWVKPAFDSLDE